MTRMKKTVFEILTFFFSFTCFAQQPIFPEFPLPAPEGNSLMARWEKKPVLDSMLIDDMEHDAGWTVLGIGKVSYTTDRAKDGKRSLRFQTLMRDEGYVQKHRTEWGSFSGEWGGDAKLQIKFDRPQDWSGFNRLSFWVYVHPCAMPVCWLKFQIENEGTVYHALYPNTEHHVEVKQGQWNHVLFEMPYLERNKVTALTISQTLRGYNSEEKDTVICDFDRIELQKVEVDQYKGWTVSPGKFSFCHTGYRPGDPKIAMVGSGGSNTFQLIDPNDKIVYTGNAKVIENKNGIFNQLDFSGFQGKGRFHIRCGKLESGSFPIGDGVWADPMFKAINFFYCQRCGFNVPGVHNACHLDWQGFYGDDKRIINGGWHDAGDLSQGYYRTAFSVFAMIRNFENLERQPELYELSERLRSEIEWGLDWLLKTRFGNGNHLSWSVMRIYTDNKIGTIDDVVDPATNIPWENFLAAAVMGKASQVFEKVNPELAAKTRIAAIEDWQAAMASRKNWRQASYLEASWGVISSITLGHLTDDKRYGGQAVRFGKLLVQCQQQQFVDGIPIAGYFFEDTGRKRVIHNYHQSFEESPLIALTMLCRSFPQNENWMQWYSAVVLHSEFFMKAGSQIAAPYNLLPNSVWKKSEIMAEPNADVRKDELIQFNDGTYLNNDYVLRTFPIYHDALFHGSTHIQMASTWALAEASSLRNDQDGMKLVGKQLQWVLGDNPFGQSLMYGVGYDFAPLFAECSRNIVGALPVGMDCISGDQPYWPATNVATYKEMWVEPVNRILGALSVYSNFHIQAPAPGYLNIRAEKISDENGMVSVLITFSGTGKHTVEMKTWNVTTGFTKQQIDLSGEKTMQIQVKLKVGDSKKPYVSVFIADKNPDSSCEIVGSLIH